MTTKKGSTSGAECKCNKGFVRVKGHCAACVRGLRCDFDKDPIQAEGYWVDGSIPTDAFEVVECRSKACLAGTPDMGESGRTRRARDAGEDGHCPAKDGPCNA